MDNGCSGNPIRVEIYLHLDTDDTSIRCYVIKHLLKINPQNEVEIFSKCLFYSDYFFMNAMISPLATFSPCFAQTATILPSHTGITSSIP